MALQRQTTTSTSCAVQAAPQHQHAPATAAAKQGSCKRAQSKGAASARVIITSSHRHREQLAIKHCATQRRASMLGTLERVRRATAQGHKPPKKRNALALSARRPPVRANARRPAAPVLPPCTSSLTKRRPPWPPCSRPRGARGTRACGRAPTPCTTCRRAPRPVLCIYVCMYVHMGDGWFALCSMCVCVRCTVGERAAFRGDA